MQRTTRRWIQVLVSLMVLLAGVLASANVAHAAVPAYGLIVGRWQAGSFVVTIDTSGNGTHVAGTDSCWQTAPNPQYRNLVSVNGSSTSFSGERYMGPCVNTWNKVTITVAANSLSYTENITNYGSISWSRVINCGALTGKIRNGEAKACLARAGIGWYSSGTCDNPAYPYCTSFEQINASTIQSLIKFKGDSGCAMTVTGGTEDGIHSDVGTAPAPSYATHENGWKIDIGFNTCVDTYIPNNYTRIANRSNGDPQYQDPNGNIYAKESNHWDIYYK